MHNLSLNNNHQFTEVYSAANQLVGENNMMAQQRSMPAQDNLTHSTYQMISASDEINFAE